MSFLSMAHTVEFSIINWSIFGLTKSGENSPNGLLAAFWDELARD
jgi:hypothetical protein